LAAQLVEPVSAAVIGVRRVFNASPGFDPPNADREFVLIASDYALAVVGERLTTEIARVAPTVRLRFRMQSHAVVDEAPESLRPVDGMIIPHGFLAGMPSAELYADEWVLIVSADNDEIGDRPTLEQLSALRWVITHNDRTAFTGAVRQLNMIGVEPRIDVVVESFLPVPFLVAGTRRVALLQRRLATKLADAAGIRIVRCPWDVVPVKEALWWHPTHRTDPGHVWFRELMVEVAGRLD
jgi:DNA-binding transcriptional LysR family regulator